jgi:Ser/Thr protein kinase RdoA (MazF antagonist)
MSFSKIKILRSIISEHSVAETIENDYSFNDKVKCKLIKACGSNDIYEVRYKEIRYILKIYSKRACWRYNKNHYLFELNLQNFLQKNGIIVPSPLQNKKGELISEIQAPEYKKYYAIYSYLNGELWETTTNDKLRIKLLARNLAHMHNITKKYVVLEKNIRLIDFNFLVKSTKYRIHKYANIRSKKLLNLIDNNIDKLENDLKEIDLNNLEWGIIHGDMHIGNHLYDPKNLTISFLDFELCGYGYHLYDIAVFKWDMIRMRKNTKVPSLEDVLIQEYSKITSKKIDTKILDLMVRMRQLFYMGSSFILYPDAVKFNNTEIFEYETNILQELS